MKQSSIIILVIISLAVYSAYGQTADSNEKKWSATERLTESDFLMQIQGNGQHSTFAQFSINYSVNGFDFLTKNFNQKVECVMYRNASWLVADVADKPRMVRYQQILFDISEVYARKFRKALLENRKQIARGVQIAEELNQKVMQEFAEERSKFESESNGGLDEVTMKAWEERIANDLSELDLFRYDNTKKIKL